MVRVSHKINMMRILTFKNEQELAIRTKGLLFEILKEKKSPLRGFCPTGRSVELLYQLLREDPQNWNGKIQALQVDEFISPDRLFFTQLKQKLIDPLNLANQSSVIDPSWSEEEFTNHIQFVLSQPIDFALLGLGPNGHIGFHEPRKKEEDFFGGKIHLTEESFHRVKGASTRWAYTFGAQSFLKAKKIFLIATGEGKEALFQKFVKTNPTHQLPATLLKSHPDFTVLTTFSSLPYSL